MSQVDLAPWRVPLADVRVDAELQAAVDETVRSGWWSMGPRVASFEDEFAEYVGADRAFAAREQTRILEGVLKAYRWQYIGSGVSDPRFTAILSSMTTDAQRARIGAALAPIVG